MTGNPERDTERLRELVALVPEAFARAGKLESQLSGMHPTIDPRTVWQATAEARALALEMASLVDTELADTVYPAMARTA